MTAETALTKTQDALNELQTGLSQQFKQRDLRALASGGYDTAAKLRSATKQSLKETGLPNSLIDLVQQVGSGAHGFFEAQKSELYSTSGIRGASHQNSYSPSGPDARAMTPPQEMPKDLESPAGQDRLQTVLQSGKLYLSHQACHDISQEYPEIAEKLVPSNSLIAHTLSALVCAFKPTTFEESTEDMKDHLIYKLTGDIIYLLNRYAPETGPLRLRQNWNSAFSTADRTNTLTSKKVSGRPDYMLVCDGLVMMLGEEKQARRDLFEAWNDMEEKLRGGYPKWSYLGISHIMAFAAAHDVLQFGVINVGNGKVTKLEKIYKLICLRQRLEVIQAVINVYSMIQPMLKNAPKDTRQRFDPSQVIWQGSSRITFRKPSGHDHYIVCKVVKDVHKFWKNPGARLELLKATYEAISSSKYCRQAFSGPELKAGRKSIASERYGHNNPEREDAVPEEPLDYMVELQPVCYASERLTRLSSREIQMIMRAGLEGCHLLHTYTVSAQDGLAGKKAAKYVEGSSASNPIPRPLVHTDLRIPNFLWDGPDTCLLSDFENCRDAGFEVEAGYSQADWDDGTCSLSNGVRTYTTQSDLYQLGGLLQQWKAARQAQQEIPTGCQELCELLRSKSSTADKALQHIFFTS